MTDNSNNLRQQVAAKFGFTEGQMSDPSIRAFIDARVDTFKPTVPATTATEDTPSTTLGDWLLEGQKAVSNAIQMVPNMVSGVGSMLDPEFAQTPFGHAMQFTSDLYGNYTNKLASEQSPAFQAANSAKIYDDATGEWHMPTATQAASTVLNAAAMLPAIIAGGGAATAGLSVAKLPSLIGGIAKLSGAGTKAAAKLGLAGDQLAAARLAAAARVGKVGTGAAGMGVIGGAAGSGDAYNEAYGAVLQTMRDNNVVVSPEDAHRVASTLAREAAIKQLPISILTNAVGLGGAKAATGGIWKRIAKGALIDAVPEVVEEGGQGVVVNATVREIDPSRDLMAGVRTRAALGLIAGGVMGGGMAGFEGVVDNHEQRQLALIAEGKQRREAMLAELNRPAADIINTPAQPLIAPPSMTPAVQPPAIAAPEAPPADVGVQRTPEVQKAWKDAENVIGMAQDANDHLDEAIPGWAEMPHEQKRDRINAALAATDEEAAVDPAIGKLRTWAERQAAAMTSLASATAADHGIQVTHADLDAIGAAAEAAPAVHAAEPAAAPKAPETVLQNRDRSSSASIEQMQSISQKPDYLRLASSNSLAEGAPVVFGDIPATAVVGKSQQVATSKGDRIPVQYAAVEADDLVASHNSDGTPVAEYANGVPGKLRAIAGNGRVAGLKLAYSKNRAGDYAAEMAADDSHGISADAIKGMRNPVLVRVMPADKVTPDIGDVSNTSGTATLSPAEMATNDIRRIDLQAIAFDEDGEVTEQSVMQFIQSMPIGERAGLMDGKRPARAAYDRLNAAIFAQAYGDPELIRLYAQAADGEAKNVMRGLAIAAPHMARLEGAGDLDIRPIVAEAATIAVNAGRKKQTLAKYLETNDPLIRRDSRVVAAMFVEHGRSAKTVGERLSDAAKFAHTEATKSTEPDMFGDVQPKATREDVTRGITDGTFEARPQSVGEPAGSVADGGHAVGQEGRLDETRGDAGKTAAGIEGEVKPLLSAQEAPKEAPKAPRASNVDMFAKTPEEDAKQRLADEIARLKKKQDANAETAAKLPDGPLFDGTAQQKELGPTEAQKEAGNYKKEHVRMHGLDIAIENPRASVRSGKDENGKEWSNTMAHDYGYIKRTIGADEDHVDVFIGPNLTSDKVFVVNQTNKSGKFDEHKVMMGFSTAKAAEEGYLANYDKGWDRFSDIVPMSVGEFKAWLKVEEQTKPAVAQTPDAAAKDMFGKTAAQESEQKLANIEAEKKAKRKRDEERAAKMSDGPLFDGTADQLEIASVDDKSDEAAAVAILDAADVRGKDRLDAMSKLRSGDYTLDDLKGAYPAKAAQVSASSEKPEKNTDGKIDDLGEKIGGARKDTAVATGSTGKPKSTDERPAWARRFEISQIVSGSPLANEEGKWVVRDSKNKDWMGQPRQVGGLHDTRADAESMVPVIAVALKHRALPGRDAGDKTTYEIWRDTGDRKRVKVVDRKFDSRDDALRYMAEHAVEIIETNTTFGEADLPKPDNVKRIGVLRRSALFNAVIDAADADAKRLANRVITQAGLSKPNGFSNIPLESMDDARLSGDVRAALNESPSYMAAVNTKLLSNLYNADAFSVEGYGSLDIPSRRIVNAAVISLGDDQKVLGSVVELIPVDVVNLFAGKDFSPRSLLGDEAMLGDLLATNVNPSVRPPDAAALALVRAVARMAAKGRLSNAVKSSLESDSALRANGANFSHNLLRPGDVSGRDFMAVFGFRSIEFGNWNNQEERQDVMNAAYDGLLDLAEVMGIPPKAISLNGDLALAFGARGHGLTGARAHYEPGKAVINLTKMNGAGALAHEWFHALDHYLARQDGKASSEWVTSKDGTRSLKVSDDSSGNMASGGFRRQGSGVREEVRKAYIAVMETMSNRAEKYVEDSAKAERFVADVRENVSSKLDSIRKNLAAQLNPEYYKRNNKPASAEQLAEFDTIAEQILRGESLTVDYRAIEGSKSRSFGGGRRLTNDALEKIGAIYKAVRGRSGFSSESHGPIDELRKYMQLYDTRLKMLSDAQQGSEKEKKIPTEFRMDAKSLDQGRGTDYWTTPHELAARAFQGYVEDKIAELGGKSPFLNYGPERAGILTPWGVKRPFPAGAERKAINAEFDKLVGAFETKETDKGVAMFRQGPSSSGRGMSAKAVTDIITNLKASRADLKVVQSAKELPRAILDEAKKQNVPLTKIRGVHHLGVSYLVADNMKAHEVQAVVFHEAYTHGGLRQRYGLQVEAKMLDLAGRLPGTGKSSERVLRLAEQQGINLTDYVNGLNHDATKSNREKLAVLTEELMAHVGETTGTLKAYLQEIVGAIRQFMRDAGFAKLSEIGITDLRNELRLAREAYIRQSGNTAGIPAFGIAYHGTPHSFDKFSLDHIGTGEGAQAYGYGHYFAGKKEIAEYYRKGLSSRALIDKARETYDEFTSPDEAADELAGNPELSPAQQELVAALREDDWLGFDYPHQAISAALKDSKSFADMSDRTKAAIARQGALYKATIPDDEHLLNWDAPVPEEIIRKVAEKSVEDGIVDADADEAFDMLVDEADRSGQILYRGLSEQLGGDKQASEFLSGIGLKGIKYLDGTSRAEGEGGHNYVIWDEAAITDVAPMFSRTGPTVGKGAGDTLQANDGGIAYKHEIRPLDQLLRDANTSLDLNGRGRIGLVAGEWAEPSRYRAELGRKNAFIAEEDRVATAEEGRVEQERLIAAAKENGFFIGPSHPLLKALTLHENKRGMEHDAYIVGEEKGRVVIRSTLPGSFGHANKHSPAYYLKRIAEYNQVFPNIQVRLIGVGQNEDGSAVILTAQAFVAGKEYDTEAELDAAMRKQGWFAIGVPAKGLPARYQHKETKAIISDVHVGNILHIGDELFPIDVIVEKMPKSSGGKINEPPKFRLVSDSSPEAGKQFVISDESMRDLFIRKIQDKFNRVKTVQRAIEESTGQQLPDYLNVYQQEELTHGKSETALREFEEKHVDPLIAAMSKAKVTREELDEYLYAAHAKERNDYIAEINPSMPDNGSGMTYKDAAAILKAWQADPRYIDMVDLAKRVYAINEERLNTIERAGLESPETIAQWRRYEAYVPLKGTAEKSGWTNKVGQGFSIKGKESKQALGRKTRAESPLLHSIGQTEQTLLRAEKNRVAQSFLKLVDEFPNADLWEVVDSPKADLVRRFDKKSREVEWAPNTNLRNDPDVFVVKVGGVEKYIRVHDERLLAAMKNLGPEPLDMLSRTLGRVNRFLAMINTSLNPEFVISNFARDIQTAIANLETEYGRDDPRLPKSVTKQVIKDVPAAVRGIYHALRKTEGKQDLEWVKLFNEFREDGGQIGFFGLNDYETKAAELQKRLNEANGDWKALGKKGVNDFLEFIMDANSSIENATRLAAYKAARDVGVSRQKAASLAKNLTVNFNRKGELGTLLNSLYLFANASIQGTAQLGRVMTSKKGRYLAAGISIAAVLLAELNRMLAGDDDDDRNFYDKVPDYVKERNLIVMKWWDDKGGYMTLPLPYGYNIFNVAGNLVSDVAHGKPVSTAAVSMAGVLVGAFSPLGSSSSQSAAGWMAKLASPTILDPALELAMNENFAGHKIYNEGFPYATPLPESALFWRSTSEVAKWVAESMNVATGGSDFRSGGIDVSPDSIEYLFGFATGGAGGFATRILDVAAKLAEGEDIPKNKIPFARKVSAEVNPKDDIALYYDRRDSLKQIEDERGAARREGGKAFVDFQQKFKQQVSLLPMVKATDKQLKQLRDQRKRIDSAKVPDSMKRPKLQQIDDRIKVTVDRFNKRYGEVVGN